MLIGRQGAEEITLDEVAARKGLDPTELGPAERASVARGDIPHGETIKVRTR